MMHYNNFWLPRFANVLYFLAVGLVVLFGCADPHTQQKGETADKPSSEAVDKKIKIGFIHGLLACRAMAKR